MAVRRDGGCVKEKLHSQGRAFVSEICSLTMKLLIYTGQGLGPAQDHSQSFLRDQKVV